MASIVEILELEPLERDIYRGKAVDTTLQRTFGGQVAGQALVAAGHTAPENTTVNSLHGYFLRGGNPHMPIVYLVTRLRDGHSFATRSVRAVQDGETIFMMSASFHTGDDEGIEHQDPMPQAPGPDDVLDVTESDNPDWQWIAREWPDWDLRFVPRDQVLNPMALAGRQQLWFRSREHLPDDPMFHIGTLAYMSDMSLLNSARAPHPAGLHLQLASLDHAMWFLKPFRADDWLFYDQVSPSAGHGRALTRGRIFDVQGNLVCEVTQEGLTRFARR